VHAELLHQGNEGNEEFRFKFMGAGELLRYLRFLLLMLSGLPVGAGQNHAGDPLDEFHFVEVDDKPERDVEEFHVAQELRFVDWQDFLHAFEL